MTIPTISSSVHSSAGSTTTSWNITLPATIAAGDILVCSMFAEANATVTFPAGWSEVVDAYDSTATNSYYIHTKTATGSEGGITITVTSSSLIRPAWAVFSLSGALETVEYAVTGVSSGANDPPSLTPSWSGDTFYITAIAGGGASTSITAAPSGYSGYIEEEYGQLDAAWAYKTGSGTENPGSFSATNPGAWTCLTIAVKGAVQSVAASFFGCLI